MLRVCFFLAILFVLLVEVVRVSFLLSEYPYSTLKSLGDASSFLLQFFGFLCVRQLIFVLVLQDDVVARLFFFGPPVVFRVLTYFFFSLYTYILALYCAESRARTGDPILFRDMLYQLSYLGIATLLSKNSHFYMLIAFQTMT